MGATEGASHPVRAPWVTQPLPEGHARGCLRPHAAPSPAPRGGSSSVQRTARTSNSRPQARHGGPSSSPPAIETGKGQQGGWWGEVRDMKGAQTRTHWLPGILPGTVPSGQARVGERASAQGAVRPGATNAGRCVCWRHIPIAVDQRRQRVPTRPL